MINLNRIGFLIILYTISINSISQHSDVELRYISPKPGSRFIMPGNNIALRYGDPFDRENISSSLLKVKSNSGIKIEGTLKLSSDLKTLIYYPKVPFQLGETILVKLLKGLKTVKNQNIRPVEFEFTITDKICQGKGLSPYENMDEDLLHKNGTILKTELTLNSKENYLPEDFPYININIANNPPVGEYYFIAPWTYNFVTDPYIIICDASGIPVYFRKAEAPIFNFKIQPNGLLSFAELDIDYKNIIIDSAYQFVESYQMENGYFNTDAHDFLALENGHVFVIGTDWQIYAMDTVVPGGHPNAMVCGFIVQEQDADKNVIFQWRSWDHFQITDAGPQIDLTDYSIDYVHGNAIEVDSDTSILISSRSLDEITRIHRNTGEIIWRFGGKKNQFNFQNDTLGFTMQHDCRRLQNGHITLFDNGRMHPEPRFSSALEYELDEVNLEATLIRRLRNDPDIYGNAMGSAQWTNDSSAVVGWGNGVPGITEFNLDGEINMEIKFQGVSYRAFRYPWKSRYFLTNTDSLLFEVNIPDSLIKEIVIANPNEFEIEITSIYNSLPFFTAANEFPIVVPAQESRILFILFNPDTAGFYQDVLTINSDINNDTLVQRIAQQIVLTGSSKTSGQIDSYSSEQEILIYPNPTNQNLIIELAKEKFSGNILLFDVKGVFIFERKFNNVQRIELNLTMIKDGIYFVQLKELYGMDSKFYKIIKN